MEKAESVDHNEEPKEQKHSVLDNLLNDLVGKKELKQILDDAPEWAKFVLITNYIHVDEHECDEEEGKTHEAQDIQCIRIAFYNTDEDSALGMITKAQRILILEDS